MENQINRDCKFSYLAGIETANFMLKCNTDLLGAVQTAMQDDLSFYRFISEEEKQRTCKEVLCFMYCLSPAHIESHIPDAIH